MVFFDPAANLPDRLQKRIDSWKKDPPTSQFQIYGPLNAYLQYKFGPNYFLVKPQALLREEDPTPNNTNEESGEADANNNNEPHEDADRSLDSIDSHGVAVTTRKRFPDFTVCQYWGANVDDNPNADVIRILVEVSSEKVQVVDQVLGNLNLVGDRFRGKIIGVAIVGNEVAVFRNWSQNEHYGFENLWRGFISLFDPKFVQELNTILTYSMGMDSDPDMETPENMDTSD